MTRQSPTVLVLASGRGARFLASGGTVHKLQVPLAGRAVLERTLDAVRASGLPWHLEAVGHPGMGDSIAAAVSATADAVGWLVLPGDLPLVSPASLQRVAERLMTRLHDADGPFAVVPQYLGTKGHPVGFAAGCRASLLALAGEHGAAPVLRALRAVDAVVELEIDDVGIVTDIDTLDDLQRVEALYIKRLGKA
jgi:molybdenum cofactor cytidylyltransferase